MKFNNDQAIYIQIMDLIITRMINGDYSAGQQLPSVRELSLDLQVNPNTVQRALAGLKAEGIVFSKRGLGNFITEDEASIQVLRDEVVNEELKVFIHNLKNLGLSKEDVIGLIHTIWEE